MKKVGELFELIDKLNADDFAVFGYYFGHINRISVDVHGGGWTPDDEPTSLAVDDNFHPPEAAMKKLEQIHKEFRAK